ncbi:MAG: hypothetical protein DKM50_09405 [Candidatus Margulisiibacteriota bacterium]|nr:MAG: hypothetical protein A2X43_02295 [Candidatus Margulisbacteria bacterium GWD2_39_127]OGI00905.1 MAG: hypothetical protein A2X42_03170 [Candidatus Margulisbacteria bacterium GWF2_38_17]OGI08760.1 MAG: hypothetical protein A2X41_05425 [Candidatus Margulisbacteria bacterium GWE2_39_32]PZM79471.1 MAG: hypothetical protein DKM50_09405 [Candidatus Margulisiibacteriota bacterium]HAR63475.1 hypothetical protein [Candidatus Margulisiibacteriota bacterium]
MTQTIKILIITFFIILASFPVSSLEKQDIKNLLNNFTWEDYEEISRIIENKVLEVARRTGYIESMRVGGAAGFLSFFPGEGINRQKPADLKNISSLTGLTGNLMFNFSRTLAVGGLIGVVEGTSSKKIADDFRYYSTSGTFQLLYFKYKPVVSDTYIVDVDLGLGLFEGKYRVFQTNEQLAGIDIVRSKTDFCYLIGTDVRYRITPLWNTGIRMGYFWAKLNDLERAGSVDEGTSIDFSAPYLAIIIGGNF